VLFFSRKKNSKVCHWRRKNGVTPPQSDMVQRPHEKTVISLGKNDVTSTRLPTLGLACTMLIRDDFRIFAWLISGGFMDSGSGAGSGAHAPPFVPPRPAVVGHAAAV